jgi:serine/threonine protein kinase
MIYELLTARPLFPGRHEVDQIRRIHSLLGTPATDVLALFSQNPNNHISLMFVPCPAQDLRNILPASVSDRAVDLMHKLLTYNPQDRISAADAMKHPAFAEIRECERRWERTDRAMPLSAYYLFGPPEMLTGEEVPVKPPKPLMAVPKLTVVQPVAVRGNPRMKPMKKLRDWQPRQTQLGKPIAPAYRTAKPAVDKSYQKPGPELLGPVQARMLM